MVNTNPRPTRPRTSNLDPLYTMSKNPLPAVIGAPVVLVCMVVKRRGVFHYFVPVSVRE